MDKKIQLKKALISVFHKEGLEDILHWLNHHEVEIYSTGGTEDFIKSLGYDVKKVENLTSYPSILGGRVKTLHPKIFGGILNRSENSTDQKELAEFDIPNFDLVIVDLYPFEKTVASGASHEDIIEKIDIGGISLIRAAAKNYNDCVIVASQNQYADFLDLLKRHPFSNLEQRRYFATQAFMVSSHYDTAIFNYFNANSNQVVFKQSIENATSLRYGENPHQKGVFYGSLTDVFEQLHGKEISYNNLLDIEAAFSLIADFTQNPTIAIMKHNNACGLAERITLVEAWNDALAADPTSAFGGIIIANQIIDEAAATEMNKIFFEVVIAPDFSSEALEILKGKKNRIILQSKKHTTPPKQFRSLLNGVLEQDKDLVTETAENLEVVTELKPTELQVNDLIFANKLVKHTKSNAIILAKNNQLLASGTGQTSRVDALNQAIEKATKFGFDLNGAVMASDAFFPFPDCVEIAHKAGIKAVIQPGGSIKDQASVDYCNQNNLSMVVTGIRHFKH